MLIAHVKFTVSAENRIKAIETLKREVEVVCAMKGSIAFVPFLDPTNPYDLGVLHEWDSADDFASYIASDSFATIGQVLRPIMTSPPISKRFDATLIEEVH